jgi:hypothetical protein
MIREFAAESGSRRTASSAMQSILFSYNPETARNPRLSCLFCDARAPEKASLWDLPPIYAQFSLVGIEPVPFHPNIKPAGASRRESQTLRASSPGKEWVWGSPSFVQSSDAG